MTSGQPEPPNIDPEIQRFAAHLSPKGDATLSILKGHLLLEEYVRELIDRKMKNPEALRESRLEFDQCLSLARALTGDEFPDWIWKALKKLNKLRNDLAHNLEPKGFEDRVKDFISFVGGNLDGTGGERVAEFMSPLNWSIAGLYIHVGTRLRSDPQKTFLDWLRNPQA